MNEPLLVSSLIIAGSEKTVEFINFEFVLKWATYVSLDFLLFQA